MKVGRERRNVESACVCLLARTTHLYVAPTEVNNIYAANAGTETQVLQWPQHWKREPPLLSELKLSLLCLCSARNTCFVWAANTGRETKVPLWPQYYVLKKGSFLLRSECKKYNCSLFATRKNHLFPSENFGKNLGWHPHPLWIFFAKFHHILRHQAT